MHSKRPSFRTFSIFEAHEVSLRNLPKAHKRLLKHLTKINAERDRQNVEIIEIAITCLRSCYIIGRNAINKSEKKERLLSDNLWSAFWLIQKNGVDISTSPVKLASKNNDNWCPQEDKKPKPSYWSEFCTENITKSPSEEQKIPSKSDNFNKWIIQCKCQAAVIELESFLGCGFISGPLPVNISI